jgi:chromosome segregation ATPase
VSEVDDLRARVDRIEAELAEVRAKAESAETLARFADRDASEIKASHAGIVHTLNALRETQLEQGQTLAEHTQILAEHSQILAEHSQILAEDTQILAEHSQAHQKTQTGIEQILSLLRTMEGDR